MKPMTIKEIQGINLEILRHIKAFCLEHQIKWWLSDGTLIGAVRHHGFIPWDDDVDIMMPREEYNRFIREYVSSEKFKLYAPELKNSLLDYGRLCEMKQTLFKQNLPWTFETPGVGIDIFVLDGCPDDYDEYLKFANQLVDVREKILNLRSTYWRIQFRHDPLGFLKDLVHMSKRLFDRIGRAGRLQRYLLDSLQLRQKYRLSDCVHCCHVYEERDARKFWKRDWFEKIILWDFCGEEFPIPVGYDFRLRAEYGDYMTPPPESERTGHEVHQTMMWRD